ncbi:nicotinate-nucleotide--dimethylbenzimidazole phosphoribosyltransferase [Streptomyces sp. NPDC006332]|uniref:nicotinate-nucleotide--dimethylbenzimidazole phosphoribosyltransferase n=1 Tax=Streptomyces sp. NPDC006332 TaxID=3155456 RepID=UPI0033BB28FE
MPAPGSEPVSASSLAEGLLLRSTLAAVTPADPAALAEARDRQNRLSKPPGSLGFLEDVSIRLTGLAGVCPPPMPELVDLGLRLGEGTGALLALPLVHAAVRALRDMATFDSAGVCRDERLTCRARPRL